MHIDYGITTPPDWTGVYIKSGIGSLYNFFFVFIVQIVIPGIISGIIIDTFAAQREANDDMNEDVENVCFICNLPREDFEASNIEFDDHIKYDHNCWKYLWYIIYLNQKKRTDFNGIEQYCLDQSNQNLSKWLPLRVAKALARTTEKNDLYTINAKISSLKSSVDKIFNLLESVSQTQNKLDKRLSNLTAQTQISNSISEQQNHGYQNSKSPGPRLKASVKKSTIVNSVIAQKS